MAVDGTYEVEASMPGGTTNLSILLKSRGLLVSGYVDGQFGKHEFSGGEKIRNEITWTILLKPAAEKEPPASGNRSGKGIFGKIGDFIMDSLSGPSIGTLPAPKVKRPVAGMPVLFRAWIKNDTITGEMEFGSYGTGRFSGTRVSE